MFLCLEKGHSLKTCSLAYSCHKCNGNDNIAVCTYSRHQDSLNTTSATNLSNSSISILWQTAAATVSNFNSPRNLIKVQVIYDSVSQRSYICDNLRQSLKLPKIRILFDALTKYQDEKCLCAVLNKGPCLLRYLFDILLRYRVGKISLTGDIKQTFLQICIDKNEF